MDSVSLAQIVQALGLKGLMMLAIIPAAFPIVVALGVLMRLDNAIRRQNELMLLLIRGMDRNGVLGNVRDEDLLRARKGRP